MTEREATHTDDSGAGVEAWILRLLLMTVLAVATSAVIASLPDIRRYLHMRRM